LGLAEAFGVVLRRCRKQAGLTQEELGLSAGIERNYVSLLELGQRNPSLVTIFGLAGALGRAPDELLRLTSHQLKSAAATRRR
jgi:transcriptional regulator with XRE-family HTH domain